MPSRGFETSATFVGFNTAISDFFHEIRDDVMKLSRWRQYLHWYESEGMDQIELADAENNLTDLVDEMQGNWGGEGCGEE